MSEASVEVRVPVAQAYEQYLQFDNYPQFIDNLSRIERTGPERVRWVFDILGQSASFEVEIIDKQPNKTVTWRSLTDANVTWITSFQSLGEDRCKIVERFGDGASASGGPGAITGAVGKVAGGVTAPVINQLNGMVPSILQRFKSYVEAQAS